MRLVIIESPYAGEVEANVEYARRCIRDSLSRGEAPIASHLLYTQPGVLRDEVPSERQWGIDAGLAWGRVADATVVYTDRGISRGMEYGIAAAERAGRAIERRTIACATIPPPHNNPAAALSQISRLIAVISDEVRAETWWDIEQYVNEAVSVLCESDPRMLGPCKYPGCDCRKRGDWPPGAQVGET